MESCAASRFGPDEAGGTLTPKLGALRAVLPEKPTEPEPLGAHRLAPPNPSHAVVRVVYRFPELCRKE